jgi:hypothetical protein
MVFMFTPKRPGRLKINLWIETGEGAAIGSCVLPTNSIAAESAAATTSYGVISVPLKAGGPPLPAGRLMRGDRTGLFLAGLAASIVAFGLIRPTI